MGTLVGAVNASAVEFSVSGIGEPAPNTLLAVDDEIVAFRSLATATRRPFAKRPGVWRVTRAEGNSTAASHAQGATIEVVVPEHFTVPLDPEAGGGGEFDIPGLPVLPTPDDADELPIVDVSAAVTKKVTVADLRAGGLQGGEQQLAADTALKIRFTGNPAGGYVTFSFRGSEESAHVAWNASPSDVAAALEVLTTIDYGISYANANAPLTNLPDPVLLRFSGPLGQQLIDVEGDLVVVTNALTGGTSPDVLIETWSGGWDLGTLVPVSQILYDTTSHSLVYNTGTVDSPTLLPVDGLTYRRESGLHGGQVLVGSHSIEMGVLDDYGSVWSELRLLGDPSGNFPPEVRLNVLDVDEQPVSAVSLTTSALIVSGLNAAPADSELDAGGFALWLDATNGAAKLKIKAKSADGTVVVGEVPLA